MSVKANIHHLISHCGSFSAHESLCILCDSSTEAIASAFKEQALAIGNDVKVIEIPLAEKHGEEPPSIATEAMYASDLIISLCQFSLAHSQARITAGSRGARFLSMPLYSWDLLSDPAVSVDFKKQGPLVERITKKLDSSHEILITTVAGTDIKLNAKGRVGNCCPGFVENASELGSPPDIEANISPVESESNGIVVVDGSITCPEIGLLKAPVILDVKDGRITSFESEHQAYVDVLEVMFEGALSKRRVLAECGIGLNPQATLTGAMLTDEGAMGCVHFGFGSNYTVGGQNEVDFHLDFVFRDASLFIDGEPLLVEGEVIV